MKLPFASVSRGRSTLRKHRRYGAHVSVLTLGGTQTIYVPAEGVSTEVAAHKCASTQSLLGVMEFVSALLAFLESFKSSCFSTRISTSALIALAQTIAGAFCASAGSIVRDAGGEDARGRRGARRSMPSRLAQKRRPWPCRAHESCSSWVQSQG